MHSSAFARMMLVCFGVALAISLCGCLNSPGSAGTWSPIAAVNINSVTADGPNVPLGNTQSFTVSLQSATGTAITDYTVAWESSNPAVFTIDPTTGVGQSVAQGTATITAKVTHKSTVKIGTYIVTVVAPVLKSISISPVTPSMVQGGPTLTFTAAGTLTNGAAATNMTVAWSSSATSVATITATGGVATAVAPGTATITATSGSVTKTTTLTVTAPVITSIAVTPADPSINVGETKNFVATATYNNTHTADVTATANWASSDTAVATVSGHTASGIKAGTTEISATVGTVVGKTTLTVNGAAATGYNYLFMLPRPRVDKTLNTYVVSDTGAITAGPSKTYTDAPNTLVSDPLKKFLYVGLGGTSPKIMAYKIDNASGALTDIAGSPFAVTATDIVFMKIDPAGKWLYVGDQPNGTSIKISVFGIDATTGVLTDSTLRYELNPYGWGGARLNFATPNNTYAFISGNDGAAYSNYRQLWGFVQDPATGALTALPGSPFSTSSPQTESVAVSYDSAWLYVALDAYRVDRFSINAATGAPSKVEMWGPGQGLPIRAWVMQNWGFWMSQDKNILEMSVDGTGAMSKTSTTTIADYIQSLEIDPLKKFLYVGHQTGLDCYAIDPTTRTLTKVGGVTMTWPKYPEMVVVPHPLE